MRAINLIQVKERVPMRDVLRLLRWRPFRVEGQELRGRCPIHIGCERKPRSFAVKGDGFFCHVCHEHGDQLRLYANVRRITVHEAAYELCCELRVAVPWLPRQPRRRKGNGEEER